jgi:hypothetical protein
MSSKSNTNSKQIYSARKPCCKVCVDAGKTEKEYSSHYVKDLNGNVTCPTLLSQECRFCKKKGHTTSHCATLKKQKESEENSRRPPLSPTKKEAPPSKKSNVFAYLEMNSDESDDEAEEFPELVAAEPKDPFKKEASAPKKFSYASMASKTQAEYKIEQLKVTNTPPPIVDKKLSVKIKKEWPALAPGQKKSWVQMCDEDSSDEEEEEEANEYFEDPFEDCVSSLAEDNSAW